MSPLSFLVLTDHSGHSDQNSVYSLITTLVGDRRCAGVDIASRGNPANASFFLGGGARVQGSSVKQSLQYRTDGRQFLENTRSLDPEDYDVVWLRLPHPVDPRFFRYLRGLGPQPNPLIVNDPDGIEHTSTKAFLLDFPELTPPTRLVSDREQIAEAAARHPIVLKPLREYGGKGIVRVDSPDAIPDLDLKEPYLAMKFLKNVNQGDKRILVVNGTILAASLRLPAPGGWLCNVAQGGRSIASGVEPEERAIVKDLAPALRRHNICFAGVDTLVGDDGKRVLSEINTLSIGGFPQAEKQTARPVLQQTIDQLFSYCYERR